MTGNGLLYEVIGKIPVIFYQHGIRDVVISPGSRNAPLTILFNRHGGFNIYVSGDERSAAFMALGISQQTLNPVVLICTSGTASLNYAPAVTEASYQGLPLLILTADRPPEWTGQGDGQTIDQNNIYFPNIEHNFQLPVDYYHPDACWAVERIANEACHKCLSSFNGPVHLNVPFREPLYPDKNQDLPLKTGNERVIKKIESKNFLTREQWYELVELLNKYPKRLIVAGQKNYTYYLNRYLKIFQASMPTPIIPDVVSNLHEVPESIHHSDLILSSEDEQFLKLLKPDVLITFGLNVLSKSLKNFFRKDKPAVHINLQSRNNLVDTFQTLTHTVSLTEEEFFSQIFNKVKLHTDKNFLNNWNLADKKANQQLKNFIEEECFGELKAINIIKNNLPVEGIIQVANSMPVRYLNILGHLPSPCYGNRGTSGIDGCVSTAVGCALKNEDKIVTLITGDMAFFYDRNGLWNNHVPVNLRIVVLNNNGGGIFRMLSGSSEIPELEEFFETKQNLNFEKTAEESNMDYIFADKENQLHKVINKFFDRNKKPAILEIKTDSSQNAITFNKLKTLFKTFNIKE